MSTNFSIKRQIFVFFYWDWLCLLEGNKIHCGGRRDHKNSLCSEEKISLEFYSLQTFRVVLMVGILQSNWWNELLKIFFYTILVGISSYFFSPRGRYVPPGYIPSSNRPVRAPRLHTLSQQTGTCPRASPSPTDRYLQFRGPPPSPNRPVRAPRLNTLSQQIGMCSWARPSPTDRYQQLRGPPLPQQTGTSPQAKHPLPTDRYVPPG
jgi:hypothetical protein